MASVYKIKRNKGKKNTIWHFDYVDENGTRLSGNSGFTDKAETERYAAKLEDLAKQIRCGHKDKEGIEYARHRESPIKEHLIDFENHLSRKQNTEKHVKLTMSRIRRIIDRCEFAKLADVCQEVVEYFIADLMDGDDGIGHRTANHYIQAIKSFSAWLTDSKRMPSNPIAGIESYNHQTAIRHKRRTLNQNEFSLLLKISP